MYGKKTNSFAEILKKYNYNPHAGDIVAGTIIHQEYSGFLVNIGNKIAGYLPTEEITLFNYRKKKKNYSLIKTTREFFLIEQNNNLKKSILSIKRIDYIRSWKRIKQFYLEDIIFYLYIQHINKGGFITYLEGIQSFIPKSQIYLKPENKQDYSNKKKNIQCKLLISNEQKNQLILSNKSAILSLALHKFKLGEILYGKILYIKPYGLFINIYGVIALLHISEISYKYINNINFFFKIGKLIKVKIIHIDTKQGRLSVSKRYMN
uniref:Ribosomal protein S1 n=1 Tax=Bostrychia simpliciuscula TaxID=324754 RepID=A0A1Z1M8F5_9FLOR|nr:ribosomal protein S1 [Bostrychia simpliciuscula]ARW62173.1 ribosomal protein S1 [Bostrychia simpliciuscula]